MAIRTIQDWQKLLAGDSEAATRRKTRKGQPPLVLDQALLGETAPAPAPPQAAPAPSLGPALVPVPDPASYPSPAPFPRPPAPPPVASWEEGKKAVRVTLDLRPLLRQMTPIAATGIAPGQVLRAAWLRALPELVLRPTYVERSREERGGPGSRIRTTLGVDASILAALARAADPLGVEGPWFLLRGQVESAFWSTLDALLGELEAGDAPSA